MKKIIILIAIVILIATSIYGKIFTDRLIHFNYSNQWIIGNNKVGSNILNNEGIYNKSILFLNHEVDESYLILGKQTMPEYYSPEYFKENTLGRAKSHYGLINNWGYSKIIKLKNGMDISVTVGRSGNQTLHQFPINTTGVWIEMLNPYYDLSTMKTTYIIYVFYYRISNRVWDNKKTDLIQNYFTDNINFLRESFINIPINYVESIDWFNSNNFKITYGEKISTEKTEEKKPEIVKTQIEFNKLSPSEKINAKWFAPNDVIEVSHLNGKKVKDGTMIYDLENNALRVLFKEKKLIESATDTEKKVFAKNEHKNDTILLKDIKKIIKGKKETFFNTKYFVELMKTDNTFIKIVFKDIKYLGGLKYIEEYINKIRKINSNLYGRSIDLL